MSLPVETATADGQSGRCLAPGCRGPLGDTIRVVDFYFVVTYSDGATSSPLREMEVKFNIMFNGYRDAYLNGGVSSVYVWPRYGEGFAAAFLLYKSTDGHSIVCVLSLKCDCVDIVDEENSVRVLWSSTHVVEVTTSNAVGTSR